MNLRAKSGKKSPLGEGSPPLVSGEGRVENALAVNGPS
jgi:hypothetical protein